MLVDGRLRVVRCPLGAGTLAALLLAVLSACGGGHDPASYGGASGSVSGNGGDGSIGGSSGNSTDGSGLTPDANRCIQPDSLTAFENATIRLGLCYESPSEIYENYTVPFEDLVQSTGGLAMEDIDGDGDLELYITRGGGLPGQLFAWKGEYFQEEVGRRGISPSGNEHSGYWVDVDGDGLKDFISIQYSGLVETFIQDQDGNFELGDVGISHRRATQGLAAADFDLDGDLDLFFSHWGSRTNTGALLSEYLWQNNGDGSFEDRSYIFELDAPTNFEWSFTPTWADVNFDGYPDLLLASDFRTSQVFLNRAGQKLENVTTGAIDDENGMGAAVGDYDRDGDLDWFVTSIWDDGSSDGNSNIGTTGNRLYVNSDGQGSWQDDSEEAEVREGYWGWGACFADFDNDGYLDIFQSNGWTTTDNTPSLLFMSNGDGTFTEKSAEKGILHFDWGRGVVCHDYDNDGLVDIFIGTHGLSPIAYRNRMFSSGNNYLKVRLKGLDANPDAIGGRVAVTTPDGTQVDEVRLGTWFISQQPPVLHFGVGRYEAVDRIEVTWPDLAGSITIEEDIDANQLVEFRQPETLSPALHVVGGEGSGIYEAGTEVAITALDPPEHYSFSHWSASHDVEIADSRSATTTIVMPDRSVSITARFLPGIYAEGIEISPGRRWIELLLQAIRNDFARPTSHARNLFHVSAAMYDSWAAFDGEATTWLLGREQAEYPCDFSVEMEAQDSDDARSEALSYAAYRLIRHRFQESPGASAIVRDANTLMDFFGYATRETSSEVVPDEPFTLGNYVASCYIEMGLQDGANEEGAYANQHYEPINLPLLPSEPGNPDIEDMNRWQPLTLEESIDQSGNVTDSTPSFIGAEWGGVWPFALLEEDLDSQERDGATYQVYHDPGVPPQHGGAEDDLYKWGFALVSIWGSHLDPDDEIWDISPASIGNIQEYPEQFEDFEEFYVRLDGGDSGTGYDLNPATQLPYEPQLVPRADYARVLAEFWADGPDSETPPGHWFVILNTVNEHPDLLHIFNGEGAELSALEWDVKGYLMLGGAMHDAAISAWSNKGWHDYLRPISAIRAMADLGQSSDEDAASYSPDGITLEEGFIELVVEDDPLAGEEGENVGKIKLYTWRGPDHVDDPESDVAGVGWILAENWWPYQRPTFVTPPFAGYVSGHSTFSRAAAETLSRLTGDRYFPGGMSGFEVSANEFLVFERGPSVDLTLQWATYQDASDQCSLSRIWGGIHPPADDIPGRLMGIKVAERANEVAEKLFDGTYSH